MRPSCVALPRSCATATPKKNETLRTVHRTAANLISASLFVDAAQKSFPLQFVHDAGVDELAPIVLLLHLHEVEKSRRILRARVGKSWKYFQPEFVGLL